MDRTGKRHPRSGIGIDKDGKLIFMTVDGRCNES